MSQSPGRASYALPTGELWPLPRSRWRAVLALVAAGLAVIALTIVILHWTGTLPTWPWEQSASTTSNVGSTP